MRPKGMGVGVDEIEIGDIMISGSDSESPFYFLVLEKQEVMKGEFLYYDIRMCRMFDSFIWNSTLAATDWWSTAKLIKLNEP